MGQLVTPWVGSLSAGVPGLDARPWYSHCHLGIWKQTPGYLTVGLCQKLRRKTPSQIDNGDVATYLESGSVKAFWRKRYMSCPRLQARFTPFLLLKWQRCPSYILSPAHLPMCLAAYHLPHKGPAHWVFLFCAFICSRHKASHVSCWKKITEKLRESTFQCWSYRPVRMKW